MYHKNSEVILDWIECLKVQAEYTCFKDKYEKGRQIGKGKFSTVFQCTEKATGKKLAIK